MLCAEIASQLSAVPALTPETRHGSTRALIDWVAALYCGTDAAPTTALRAAFLPLAGQGSSAVVGAHQLVDPRTAALINATAAHATEVDDIYRDGIYHPGAPTIAAAVSLGQHRGIDGAELLRAIALGYEVGCRIAAAVQPSHYRYWHTTGTVGTLGAAAASAAALDLSASQAGHGLALATTFAAGLQQSFRSEAMAKPMHAGHAADAGVMAALAAQGGITGALDVLEGAAGFGAAMSSAVDWGTVIAPFAEPFAINALTVKNHTACGHTFAPIDATLALFRRHGLVPDDVQQVVVETAAIPIEVAGARTPTTAFEAKFSIPYCVASAILLGSVRLDAFSEEALADPAVAALASRVQLRVGEEFDAVFPTRRAARVIVTRRDGAVVSETAWTRRGDPDDPLDDDELCAKFIELTTPTLGADGAAALLERLWKTESARDLSRLFGAP